MATLSLASPYPTVHCIYRIVNFRIGKVYVGQTKYERDRYEQHFAALKKQGHHSRKLQNAYKKYGDSAFYFEVIERDIPADKIDEREAYWISYYDSFRNGYNCTPGGKSCGGNYKSVIWGGIEYESIQAVSEISGLTVGEIKHGLRRKGYISTPKPVARRERTVKPYDQAPYSQQELTDMAVRLGLIKAA